MRWGDERYVRVYCRDTGDWNSFGWEGRALFVAILRKCDRAGILDVGKRQIIGLASIVDMPEEVVSRALPVLIDDGCLVSNGHLLVVRNYIDAQESAQSNAQRAKEKRARDRERGLTRTSQQSSQNVTTPTRNVSQTSRERPWRNETDLRAVPSRAVPDPDPPVGPPPGPQTSQGELCSDPVPVLSASDPDPHAHADPRRKKRATRGRRTIPAPEYSDGFKVFWTAYPRKVGKGAAWAKWPGEMNLAAIMAALEWQCRSHDWTKDGGEYIPNPSSYLHQRRWEDEPRQTVVPKSKFATPPNWRKTV